MGLIHFGIMIVVISVGFFCRAQEEGSSGGGFKKKINLEDVSIKGEVNKRGSLLTQRTKMNLDDRIKVPKNFRKAILENLDPELEGIGTLEEKK